MTIPASDIVNVNPGVVSAGGNPLSLNGVLVTQNTLVPTGSVIDFGSPAEISSYFGPASAEYAASKIYFLGYDNSTVKPGTLYFAPYVASDRAAFLRGGSLAGMTLTQLQALSGTIILTIDGVVKTSSSINLSAATSFSNAATIIAAAFTGGPAVTWNAVLSAFNFASTTTGAASTITYATGTLSTGLKLTSATSAILSQGADADTPDTAMNNVINVTQNWCSFTTMFEPDLTGKEDFAVWTNAQNQRYMYVAWDTDGQAIVQNSTTCFGAIAKAAEYDGVVCVSGDANVAAAQGKTLAQVTFDLAVFVMGEVASIDFSQTNGRITTAFKTQSGLAITVDNQTNSNTLLENGYSFYGSYATAADNFVFFYNGQMTGKWKWIDPFVNQVYLNSQFQLALMNLLANARSIPYTESGYSLIRATLLDPISAGINFGSIRAGVQLSNTQKAEVNFAAGRDISQELQQQGYYLQVLDPGATVRGNRGTPVINFWYTDGGAVQYISMASIDVM